MISSKFITEEKLEHIDFIFKVFTLLLTVGVGVSLFRVFYIGWIPAMSMHIVFVIVSLSIYIFHNSIPYILKSLFMILTCILISVVGAINLGMTGSNILIWVTAGIITSTLIEYRVGILVIFTGSLLFLILGWISVNGLYSFDIKFIEYHKSIIPWITVSITMLFLGVLSTLIIERINHSLRDKLETIRIQREELFNSNRTKDMLYSVISHDLKGPFNGLLSGVELIRTDHDSFSEEERNEILDNIISDTKNTFSMLENLLHWSTLQREGIVSQPTVFNLKKHMEIAVAPYRQALIKKQISYHLSVPDSITVFADESSFRIVISNLISNAIKFTPEQGTINVLSKSKDDQTIIEISDTGVGIAKQAIELLFDANDHTTTFGTQGEKGTGLGLGLCGKLIAENKGTITVNSEIGSGSTFIIQIPSDVI